MRYPFLSSLLSAERSDMPITIDVVHDTVCPWCRIGKRHLMDAIANLEGEAPLVRWHPYFLNPSMPAGGVDFRGYLASIMGDDHAEPMILAVTRAGTQAGLRFNWDRVRKAPNTLRSHALIHAAPQEERHDILDEIHLEYFERGGDIGNRDQLAKIERNHGVDSTALDDQAHLDAIAGRAEAARSQGISGVPTFLFDGRTALSGAQPPSVLLAAIEEASAAALTVVERRPNSPSS